METDPRRRDGNHDLRDYDQARHPNGSVIAARGRKIFTHHRQHRRVGKLKESDRGCEQNELPVFAKGEDPRGGNGGLVAPPFAPRLLVVQLLIIGRFATFGIAGARIVNLVAVNKVERDQRGNAERRGGNEDGTFGYVCPGYSHKHAGERVTGGGITIIPASPHRHSAASDQAETDGADSWRDDTGCRSLQNLRNEH